jgi:hypothetical protein
MITLVEPIAEILPAFNRINYTISSTNANLSGFKYVVKVYNSNDELITQAFYDSPANPADSVEFDVSKFVSVNFDYSSGFYQVPTSVSNTNVIKGYYLKCYEYYEVAGVFQIVSASEVVSATKYAFAASFPLLEFDQWSTLFTGFTYADYLEYTGQSNTEYKPLTDWDTIKLRETDSQIFGFINTGLLTNCELLVTYANATTQTYFITPAEVVDRRITYIKITPSTYGSNVNNIQLFVNWNNGSARRYKFATLYTQSCGRYDPMRLAYLNKYGVYDFFNFDLVSKTTFDVEKKGYERNYSGSIYESDGIRVKNINPIYYTKETQKWKIISDYLTDSQAEILRELYSSPLVYMNLVNDNYISPSWIPAKPTATSYEVKKTAIDKVFNIELELEFQLINNRQVI